jgi:hypothetical protein
MHQNRPPYQYDSPTMAKNTIKRIQKEKKGINKQEEEDRKRAQKSTHKFLEDNNID